MPMQAESARHGTLRAANKAITDTGSTRSGHSAALAWLGGHPRGLGRSVVTIGSYDGVHRGHQLIIRHAVDRARALGVPSVVVTFDPHPSEVVRPGSHPPLLAPHHRRAELMAELGVDALLIVPFTTEFSKLSPADFVVKVLVDKLHARAVVEGPNFRFGHKAAGNVGFLREQGETYDFEVEVVDLFVSGEAGGGEPFSSTLTRRLVTEGDVEGAREILGRPHRVEGVVVRGAQRGRELGFPTANVETLPHTAIPADGVYAGFGCTHRARPCPPRSPWARTRSSTAPSARWRRTPSTVSASTSTVCTSPSTSSRSSAARPGSTPSRRCWWPSPTT